MKANFVGHPGLETYKVLKGHADRTNEWPKWRQQAIEHIRKYGSRHTEAILTNDHFAASQFSRKVDASTVIVNASTRFTDGGEFGFGAEIGISTQKLHARGPMGLKELNTYKYLVYGNGQTRG